MTPEGPLFHKPKSFITAEKLSYAAIFIGILAFLIREVNIGFTNNGGFVSIVLIAVGYSIIYLLIKQMRLCRKWARTTLLVLYIISMATYPFLLEAHLKIGMMEAALLFIQAMLEIIALVFLYTKESNVWFNNSSSGMLP